jgi:hypothetical protein
LFSWPTFRRRWPGILRHKGDEPTKSPEETSASGTPIFINFNNDQFLDFFVCCCIARVDAV